ncbi:uncharacterized protein LOC134413032 [Elgaria multicarinata webbii]|uniref:uncharacterized protein LOC134413032 n=1 Tax=Elgaria multicarinata webbii TaxID=159646 RepID=UPI002FCCC67C
MSNKKKMLICGLFQAIGWFLFIIFLGLYISEWLSEPSVRLAECQSELQNQSSQTQARIASLGQCMEAMEKEKKKDEEEGGRLRVQLVNANQSVDEMKGRWDACQTQLKRLEKNVSSEVAEAAQREAEKRKTVEEEVKHLKQQLHDKTEALKDAQRHSQQYQREKEEQREKYEADIQQLQDELKNKASKSSRAAALGGPITALFPIIFGGLFFFLFL